MGTVRKADKRPAPAAREAKPGKRVSKVDQILGLFLSGIHEVEDLALITHSRPTYVAGVLQDNGLMQGYFDLYTSSAHPMNVYSKFFEKRLGFKDVHTAEMSVAVIDTLYKQFALGEDRAGQHHALLMALTMFDRARWTNKGPEADVFRRWLVARLNEAELPAEAPSPPPKG
jgi:hypothetical protein